MILNVATCQFPMSSQIESNRCFVIKQTRQAKQRGADVVHFPECALSGYADVVDYRNLDWKELETATQSILALARELDIWVILGSSHQLSANNKPHNCLYIVNNQGKIVDRYGKMFCAGRSDNPEGELAYYSPGDHFCVFEIAGIRCGASICHEYRYPELYREYKRRDVTLMFHSFHAGNYSQKKLREMQQQVGRKFHRFNPGKTLPEITMPAGMHARAADNSMWISCSNTSAPESSWASFVVRPDGVIVGGLRKNVAGVLLTKIDTATQYYDATGPWRNRAMNGQYHSGTLVKDKRSSKRTSL